MTSLLRGSFLALVLAPVAGAQCLDWSRAFPPPGVLGNLAQVDALVVDTGGDLILGGSFAGADTVLSTNAVRWTGSGYQPLSGITLGVTDLWRIDLGAGPAVYAGSFDTAPLRSTAWTGTRGCRSGRRAR